jgi:hypothetical protein
MFCHLFVRPIVRLIEGRLVGSTERRSATPRSGVADLALYVRVVCRVETKIRSPALRSVCTCTQSDAESRSYDINYGSRLIKMWVMAMLP